MKKVRGGHLPPRCHHCAVEILVQPESLPFASDELQIVETWKAVDSAFIVVVCVFSVCYVKYFQPLSLSMASAGLVVTEVPHVAVPPTKHTLRRASRLDPRSYPANRISVYIMVLPRVGARVATAWYAPPLATTVGASSFLIFG